MMARLLVLLGWPSCSCCGRPADLFAGERLACRRARILGAIEP